MTPVPLPSGAAVASGSSEETAPSSRPRARRSPLLLGAAAEGRLARQHLVEDDAQGVDVRALVEGVARGLLGRDVARRAVGDLRRVGLLGPDQLDDAEVCDLDAVAGRDHDVRGLEVAVDDPLARLAALVAVDEGVRVGDGVEYLLEEVERALLGQTRGVL